ncbi:MAG: YdeI/OmpD-associated family protein [Gemmatimonadetes bacterium]|nr:YdeI/OmpD-associated family protein [Gemmatimonadota bacterium]
MNAVLTFAAVIDLAGINPYVTVPAGIVAALGGGAKIPVHVKAKASAGRPRSREQRSPTARPGVKNADKLKAIGRLAAGEWFRTTLVRHASAMRLYLDQWMRDAAGVGVGDRVRITVKPDPGSRMPDVPYALQQTLDENPKAKSAWAALTPSRRKEILSYLNFLKGEDALARNVRKVVAQLLE